MTTEELVKALRNPICTDTNDHYVMEYAADIVGRQAEAILILRVALINAGHAGDCKFWNSLPPTGCDCGYREALDNTSEFSE